MVAKKAAVKSEDAATFDVSGWLRHLAENGFKPANVTVKMHLRGDLLPRIKQLVDLIQAQSDKDAPEVQVGVNDTDPLGGAVAEYQALTAELEAGGCLEFVFQPMTKATHNATYKAWEVLHPGDTHSDDDWDELALMRMVATCVGFPGKGIVGDAMTVEAFRAFESTYGTPAFNTLVAGWSEAYSSGGEVTAPFLPKPSPTPDTEE